MKCKNCGETIEGIGFKCRHCRQYFCSSCRLPETHNCNEFKEKNNQIKNEWTNTIKILLGQEKKESNIIYDPKPNKVSIIKTSIKKRKNKKIEIKKILPWIIVFISIFFLFYKIFID